MDDASVREMLRTSKTIAVVGLSSDPMRASYSVSEYMQLQGYKLIPVNPRESAVLGERAVAQLDDVATAIDIVNVFRRPEFVPQIVQAAIRKKARCLWLQQGIEHPEAEKQAADAGLFVIADRCIYREHRRLLG